MTLIPAILTYDTREQHPWRFERFASKHVTFDIQREGLPCGDYLAKLADDDPPEACAVVERKTHSDLIGSLTTGRARFERELEKLTAYGFKALVIEASLPAIARGLDSSRANPVSIIGSLIAFSQRYGLHVVFASDRRHAQAYAWRLCERWVRDRVQARAEAAECAA